MNTWAPLWSFSPESSLWDEPDYVFKVFITMMAVKDADHVVRFTAYQLARKARKTEEEVMKALKVLSGPDRRRMEHQEFEGRRVQKVEEGWLILNGEKYRAMVSLEMRRARNRRGQAAHRERQKRQAAANDRERRYVKAAEAGDVERAETIAAEGLPGA